MTKLDIAPQQNDTTTDLPAGAIVIGSIVDFDTQGRPRVDFNENPESEPLVALTTLSLNQNHTSRQVALLFNQGDFRQPVIMGLIHNPLDELLENFELTPTIADTESPAPEQGAQDMRISTKIARDDENQVYVDGERVSIEGAEEVTFKCGKASITLTKSGKIMIRGTYLLNRSTGVNRILGGSVQVN